MKDAPERQNLDVLGQPPIEEMPEIDVAALRANLRLSVEERLAKMVQMNDFVIEMNRAGEQYRAEQRSNRGSTSA